MDVADNIQILSGVTDVNPKFPFEMVKEGTLVSCLIPNWISALCLWKEYILEEGNAFGYILMIYLVEVIYIKLMAYSWKVI
jgi:hypothetical protein